MNKTLVKTITGGQTVESKFGYGQTVYNGNHADQTPYVVASIEYATGIGFYYRVRPKTGGRQVTVNESQIVRR